MSTGLPEQRSAAEWLADWQATWPALYGDLEAGRFREGTMSKFEFFEELAFIRQEAQGFRTKESV